MSDKTEAIQRLKNETVADIVAGLAFWIEENVTHTTDTIRRQILSYAKAFDNTANASNPRSDEWRVFNYTSRQLYAISRKYYKREIDTDAAIDRIYELSDTVGGQ